MGKQTGSACSRTRCRSCHEKRCQENQRGVVFRNGPRVSRLSGVDRGVHAAGHRAPGPGLSRARRSLGPTLPRGARDGAAETHRESARTLGLPLGARSGRAGLRSGQAGPDERNSRPQPLRPQRVRLSGPGFGQCGNPGQVWHRGAEGEVFTAAARRRDRLLFCHDRASGGGRSGRIPVHGHPRR